MKDRRKRKAVEIAEKFKSVLRTAKTKVTLKQLFSHFDKDKGNSVDTKELGEGTFSSVWTCFCDTV